MNSKSECDDGNEVSAEELHAAACAVEDAVKCLETRDGFRHWKGRDMQIAYWQVGRTRLTLGGPSGELEQRRQGAQDFVKDAEEAGKKVCFGVIESGGWLPSGFSTLCIGYMPLWQPREWTKFLRSKGSLREQVRRSRAKNITTQVVDHGPEIPLDKDLAIELRMVMRSWYQDRPLPPLGYALQPQVSLAGTNHKLMIATKDSRAIAFMRVLPMYGGKSWFVENVYRGSDVPNGTIALLVECLMASASDLGIELVSFGLVPLSGKRSRLLQVAYFLLRPAYNFEGLYNFRKKFGPAIWVPIYVAYPKSFGQMRALLVLGQALCDGQLYRFFASYLRRVFRLKR